VSDGAGRDALLFENDFKWIYSHVTIQQLLYSSNNIHSHSVSLDAKHANDKAAKKANANRPRKSRPSDINRKPTNYPTFVKPPEYTISDN